MLQSMKSYHNYCNVQRNFACSKFSVTVPKDFITQIFKKIRKSKKKKKKKTGSS